MSITNSWNNQCGQLTEGLTWSQTQIADSTFNVLVVWVIEVAIHNL